ncbi:hypothetical protein MTO96_034338 [Rhipicephalus appendiculatus]
MATPRRLAASVAATLLVLAWTWTCCIAEDELALQARMTPCELIRYHHYPCEIIHVTTKDGYVIEVDRVPRGRQDGQGGTSRYPVLLVTALLCASDIWFLNYPSQSLGKCFKPFSTTVGFLLADAGFDVWSMNTREVSRYSNHTTLSKDDPAYWKFSFDEIGRYDIPAVVDHVLNATGAKKLTIVCMSQGGAASLVFLSMRPEYNKKVDLVVAYCPAANVSRSKPPASLVLRIAPLLSIAAYPFSRAGYLGASEGLSEFLSKACKIFNGEACSLAISITAFASPYQLNETRMPVYVGHYPVGTTIQNYKHYHQNYEGKDFLMYDHGAKENRKRYGQADAPAYPLERIRTPWAIFSSEGDTFASPGDVEPLVARLGARVIMHQVVPQKSMRHADFGIGYRTNKFLHDVAIDVIKKHVLKST